MTAPASHELPIIGQSVKVSATFWSAFADAFNLLMVGSISLGIVVGTYSLLTSTFDILWLLVVLFSASFMFLYLWAILTRAFEVNADGIVYREAFRTVVIKWDEVDSIQIEPGKKQITFWVHGKRTRIHTFGLNPKELAPVEEAFVSQTKAHGIALK